MKPQERAVLTPCFPGMPRYFFHCDGARRFTDEEGTELPNRRAAELQAIQQAGEILRDHPDTFAEHPTWRVLVTDGDRHRAVFVLGFNAVSLPD